MALEGGVSTLGGIDPPERADVRGRKLAMTRRKKRGRGKGHVMIPQGLKPRALRALYVGAEAPTP
jgi:hypothetical protein